LDIFLANIRTQIIKKNRTVVKLPTIRPALVEPSAEGPHISPGDPINRSERGGNMRPVSLSGVLSSMPLTDLLQWLDQGRKSGSLQVHGSKYTKTIITTEGQIIASGSTDPNDYLGHFLLRQGKITEEQLQHAMEVQRTSRKMLGKILVTSGLIDEVFLQTTLVQKAEETIFSLFLWKDGRFEFRDGDLPGKVAVPLKLKISDVLLKGLTWYDEFKHIRKIFASSASVVARTRKPLPAAFENTGSLPRRILDLVDGKHSIAEIAMSVHASEFAVGKLLHLLLKQGFIEVRKHEAERRPVRPNRPIESIIEEARSMMRCGEAQAALKTLEEAKDATSNNEKLQDAIGEARAAFVHQAYRDGLKPDSVPALLKPLEDLTGEPLTPEEMFLLSRINGSWDIRAILSVCPFPEPDALLHLKKLKDRGLLGMEVPAGAAS
jgi:hypothetical protein